LDHRHRSQARPPLSTARYAVTACVLLYRGDEWLLSVRASGVAYAPGRVGLIGGHLEPADGNLETTARRELAEETGIELGDAPLHYLESELFDASGEPQVSVTFVAAAPPDAAPGVRQPEELAELGWWTQAALDADPRCPEWLAPLTRRAAALREASSRDR
jgi:8-oxo-dGTP pyrophosphatase MutT (NUDIX family)